jgi:hypothetical protein
MKCEQCGSIKLRTSRLQRMDLPHLLLLQLPVRCRSCSKRRYVGLRLALQLRKEEKIREEERLREKRRRAGSVPPPR